MTKALRLMKTTLFVTIIYQIIFKIFYVSVLFFIVKYIITIILSAIDHVISGQLIGTALSHLSIPQLFNIHFIVATIVSLGVIIVVYSIEKNGVIILTAEYNRNNPISLHTTLIRAVQSIPRFVLTRIIEMRAFVITFMSLYILWRVSDVLLQNDILTRNIGFAVVLYGILIYMLIFFQITFTAYVVNLNPDISPTDFKDTLPQSMHKTQLRASIIFYIIFTLSVIIAIVFVIFLLQFVIMTMADYPSLSGLVIAFFLSCIIIIIIIILSILKTFKACLMSVLYNHELERRNISTQQTPSRAFPYISQHFFIAIFSLLTIAVIGGSILTATITEETYDILHNAQNYALQNTYNTSIDPSTIDPYTIAQRVIIERRDLLTTTKEVVLEIFAIIINK